MKILVTGANGYIGSHLVPALLADGHTIHAVQRSSSGRAAAGLHEVIADLSSAGFVKALPEKADVVVHLAQSKEYRNFPEKDHDIYAVNVQSTQLLLEWAKKSGVKKFILASTGNVYKQQNKLIREDDACEPIGYYGASKYAAEQLAKPYSDLFQTTILRIFGVYGTGQKNMTIPNIIDRVKSGQEITLAKNAGLYFTPLHICDCVAMLRKVIVSEGTKKYELYNVAGSEAIHLGRLVDLISKFAGITPVVKANDNEPMYLMGDGSAFYRDFSYTPSVSVENGIAELVK